MPNSFIISVILPETPSKSIAKHFPSSTVKGIYPVSWLINVPLPTYCNTYSPTSNDLNVGLPVILYLDCPLIVANPSAL